MTALDALDDRIKGIEAGADDFLTKPVNERELIARIQTALKLKEAMDHQVARVSQVRDHFAKFVPEAVKQLVAEDPDAPELGEKREQELTVLFVDISGYTRLSERLPADRLNELVERHFSAFLDCIQDAGGDINETAGDGFMAIFQGADPEPHAQRATRTGLDLLGVSERLNRENSEQPLRIHMGLSSGVALVGSTRFEGARGTRWTFTASGAVTNLASRLADAAEAGQILVSAETVRQLSGGFRLENLGRRALRNLAEAVEIYRVRGEGGTDPATPASEAPS